MSKTYNKNIKVWGNKQTNKKNRIESAKLKNLNKEFIIHMERDVVLGERLHKHYNHRILRHIRNSIKHGQDDETEVV